MKYLLEVLFVLQYDQQYIYYRSHLWLKISQHFALFLSHAQSLYSFDQIPESLEYRLVQKSGLIKTIGPKLIGGPVIHGRRCVVKTMPGRFLLILSILNYIDPKSDLKIFTLVE